MSAAPLLGIDDLCLRRGARDVLCGVTAQVRRGELVALMGLSGAGKSTVLRAVAALEPFDRGTIVVGDARLTAGPLPPAAALRPLRAQVGMVFQHHSLFEHLPAVHNVWLAPVHVHRTPQKEAEQRALQLLEELGVGHRARALPREISGGEAQRVAIARALAMDPPLLLMDEPTASLDPARRDDLGQTLRSLTASGRTLLLTTHDDDFVRDYADRIAVLADGLVVEEGDPREILAHPSHPATIRLLQNAHNTKGLKIDD